MSEVETKPLPEASVPAARASKASSKPVIEKKRDKKAKKTKKSEKQVSAIPQVTGRVAHVEVGTNGVSFIIGGKKNKGKPFDLKGIEASSVPAATALLASAVANRAKLRVEYASHAEGVRTVVKLIAQR